MTDRVQSIERSIDILAALASGPKTVTEVARATDLSKATAFRLVASLSYRSLVIKDTSTNLYMLGPGFLQLVDGVARAFGSIASLARPALERLLRTTGETVILHVRVAHERIVVEQLPSPKQIRYTAHIGSAAPLYVGSAGKVLLAFLSDDERQEQLRSLELHRLTDKTITRLDDLVAELDKVRAKGWAASYGERVSGAAAISVPARGPEGFLAALSVLGPADRLTEVEQERFLPSLLKAASEVEAILASATDGTSRRDRKARKP